MLSGRRGDKPAAAGCFSLKTNKKQILRADYSKVFKQTSALRSAPDDMGRSFFQQPANLTAFSQGPAHGFSPERS